MKLKPSSYALIAIIIIALAFIISSLRLEYFESKLLPLLFGGAVLILAAVELVQELGARAKVGSQVTAGEEGPFAVRRGGVGPGQREMSGNPFLIPFYQPVR